MIGITWICADIIHGGHLSLLRRAKNIVGEDGTLVVCIATDNDIKRRKNGRGERYPLKQRLEWVSDLRSVDRVDIQDPSFTKKDAVAKWKPDVIFVSDEYQKKNWEGAKLGVPVTYLPYTEGVSSTSICQENSSS